MALAHYSSLFTSGLLCDSQIASSSERAWALEKLGPRRGSLPTSVSSPTSDFSSFRHSTHSTMASGQSFYFTVQKKRRSGQYRSFLSLDLAETRSMRSGSLTSTKPFAAPPRKKFAHLASFVSVSNLPIHQPADPRPITVAPPTSSPVRRTSRESLRSIPSPKPVPSATLPPLPSAPSSAHKRSLSPMRFASPRTSVYEPSIASPSCVSRASTTVSSGYRREKRCAALARLEGRSLSRPENFMSMSDDEDQADDEDDEEDEMQALSTPEFDDPIDPWLATVHTPVPASRSSTWTRDAKEVSLSDALGLNFLDALPMDDVNFIDLRDDHERPPSGWSSSFVSCTA